MKNTQKIINDTIVDHDGHKRFTQMILGDPENGYVQGTILDANAVAEVAGLNNINVHQIFGKHTLAEAIDLVNEQDRKIGTIISYTTNNDEEVLKQFVGTSLAQWDIENAWVDYDKDAKPKDVCSTIYIDQSYVTKGVRPRNKFILVPTMQVTTDGDYHEYLIVFVDGRFWYFFSPKIDNDKSIHAVFVVRDSGEIYDTCYERLESAEENGARTFFESKNIHSYGGVLRGIMNNEHLTFNIVNDYYSYTIDEIMQNSVSLDECAWEDMDPNTPGDTQIRIYGDVAANRDDEGNLIYEQKETSDGLKTVVSTKSYLENAVSNLRKNTKRVVFNMEEDGTSINDGLHDVTRFYHYADNEDRIGVFIQLPKFWWKCTETDIRDLFKLEIVTDAKYANPSFKEWSGDTYIARYKTSLSDSDGKLVINNGVADHSTYIEGNDIKTLSMSGYPTSNLSYDDLREIIRNTYADLSKTAKLSMIKYDSHKIMAMLFMAYYGDNDIQAICGSGKDWIDHHPVMQEDGTYRLEYDTIASENPDNVWFWGLCDWAGNVYEFVDDMHTIMKIEESTIGKVVGTNAYSTYNGCIGLSDAEPKQNITETVDGVQADTDDAITHLILGNNFELLPAAGAVYANRDSGFKETPWKDYVYIGMMSKRIARRSGYSSDTVGGLFCITVGVDPSVFSMYEGSRLEYTGPTVKKY